MNAAFVFLWMIFFHIIDDYYIQSRCLSFLKQKSWWKENAPDKLYEHDYIWALIMHAFSWAFMIMLPIAYHHGFAINKMFVIMILINAAFHAIIDDQKANRKSINLWADQWFHILQIVITFVMFY